MDRTPATIGPPPCFGRRRKDDVCAVCPYKNRCRKASKKFLAQKTVAEAVADLRRVPSPECPSAEQLLDYVLELTAKYRPKGRRTTPEYRSKLLYAFNVLRLACFNANWNPKRYLRAQVESLSMLLEKGYLLSPGHFCGPKAGERFRGWIRRREHRHGDAHIDRSEAETIAAERRRAASAVYAALRLNGCDVKFSQEHARSQCKGWDRRSITADERVIALWVALSSVDPMLKNVVLLPPGPLTWGHIARLGQHILSSRGGVRVVPQQLDGELL